MTTIEFSNGENMVGNIYKTEEMIDGKADSIVHFNLLEAIEWVKSGIDVRLFRQSGDKWIEVSHDPTKMQADEKDSSGSLGRLRIWLSDMHVQRQPDIEPCNKADARFG